LSFLLKESSDRALQPRLIAMAIPAFVDKSEMSIYELNHNENGLEDQNGKIPRRVYDNRLYVSNKWIKPIASL